MLLTTNIFLHLIFLQVLNRLVACRERLLPLPTSSEGYRCQAILC